MKTIMVATNYSSEANNATRFAAELARYMESKLVLFNAFELSVHSLNTLLPADEVDRMFDANKKKLAKIATAVAHTFNITVECRTRIADMKEELDRQVQRYEADLVVIGMNEKRCGYGFNNTAASVVHHARYPVLAVPLNATFNGISKILVAVGPGAVNVSDTFPFLQKMATSFNAEVELCHVEQKAVLPAGLADGVNATMEIETMLCNVDHCYKTITEKDILKGIVAEAENMQADIVVMVPRRYGFWESIMHKSKTMQMVRKTHLPLLALPG